MLVKASLRHNASPAPSCTLSSIPFAPLLVHHTIQTNHSNTLIPASWIHCISRALASTALPSIILSLNMARITSSSRQVAVVMTMSITTTLVAVFTSIIADIIMISTIVIITVAYILVLLPFASSVGMLRSRAWRRTAQTRSHGNAVDGMDEMSMALKLSGSIMSQHILLQLRDTLPRGLQCCWVGIGPWDL